MKKGGADTGWLCAACMVRTRVVDSRAVFVGGAQVIRRRRVCERCHARFTTYETLVGRTRHKIGSSLRRVREMLEDCEKLVQAVESDT